MGVFVSGNAGLTYLSSCLQADGSLPAGIGNRKKNNPVGERASERPTLSEGKQSETAPLRATCAFDGVQLPFGRVSERKLELGEM